MCTIGKKINWQIQIESRLCIELNLTFEAGLHFSCNDCESKTEVIYSAGSGRSHWFWWRAFHTDIDNEEVPQDLLHNLSDPVEDNTNDSEIDNVSDNETYTPDQEVTGLDQHRTPIVGILYDQIHHRPGFSDGLSPECEKEAFDIFTTDSLEILVRYTYLEARRRFFLFWHNRCLFGFRTHFACIWMNRSALPQLTGKTAIKEFEPDAAVFVQDN